MSLEENLAAATNALGASTAALDGFYDDQLDPINAKIAQLEAARNALPDEMLRRVYVDAVAGDDANDGRTAATAVQSFHKAADFLPPSGLGIVLLVTDVVVTNRFNLSSTRGVRVGAANSGPKPKLSLSYFPSPGNSFADEVSAFIAGEYGCAVRFIDVDIVIPDRDPNIAAYQSYGVVGAAVGGGQIDVSFHNAKITMPADPACEIIAPDTRTLSLNVSSTTYSATTMPGRWITGVPANADPLNYPDILTNLGTL